MKEKQALTTGEVAKYCGVNFRTVIRWIERGHLQAYKLPGRGDNRIPIESFVEFLQDNNMPVPEDLLIGQRSVLVYAEADECSAEIASLVRKAGWDVLICKEPLQFGYLIATKQPAVIVLAKEEFVEPLSRLVKEIDNPELLLVLITQQSGLEAGKQWQVLQWPSQSARLHELLQEYA